MTRREPKFLNVDLDVESREPLGRLADALPSLLVLFSGRVRGRHMLSMELSDPALLVDPTVRHMARTISRLSGVQAHPIIHCGFSVRRLGSPPAMSMT